MKTWKLRAATLPALLATTALISACGSSQGGSSSSASTGASNSSTDVARSHFTSCLESHGVKVTYASDGTALGIFDNYAMLPENGVSGPRRWTHP